MIAAGHDSDQALKKTHVQLYSTQCKEPVCRRINTLLMNKHSRLGQQRIPKKFLGLCCMASTLSSKTARTSIARAEKALQAVLHHKTRGVETCSAPHIPQGYHHKLTSEAKSPQKHMQVLSNSLLQDTDLLDFCFLALDGSMAQTSVASMLRRDSFEVPPQTFPQSPEVHEAPRHSL